MARGITIFLLSHLMNMFVWYLAFSLPGSVAPEADLSRGSAMIVKREAAGEYNLRGTFIQANRVWSVQPLARQKRDAEKNQHQIFPLTRVNSRVNMTGNEIINSEYQEFLKHQRNGSYRRRGRRHYRHKRALTQHVLEVAFIVDYKDYSKWESLVGADNALSEMRLWYTYLAESVNIRFLSIDDADIAISIVITVLKIITVKADAAFIENLVESNGTLSASASLDSLKEWYPRQSDVPSSDYCMLFTGYKLLGLSGISYPAGMCTNRSVSVVENQFTGFDGSIAAHELGHSLTAPHDSETDSCSDKSQFVMATITQIEITDGNEGNPWKFSPCSIEAFKKYLSSVNCTLPENTGLVNVLPVPEPGARAGQVLNRDEQCKLFLNDTRTRFCQEADRYVLGMEDIICEILYCKDPNTNTLCFGLRPQEFTSCGTGKWCVSGRCVNISQADLPTATATTMITTPTTTASSTTSTTTAPTTSTTLTTSTATTPTSPTTKASSTTSTTTAPTITTTSTTLTTSTAKNSTSPTTTTSSTTSTTTAPSTRTTSTATMTTSSTTTYPSTASTTSTTIVPTTTATFITSTTPTAIKTTITSTTTTTSTTNARRTTMITLASSSTATTTTGIPSTSRTTLTSTNFCSANLCPCAEHLLLPDWQRWKECKR